MVKSQHNAEQTASISQMAVVLSKCTLYAQFSMGSEWHAGGCSKK